MISSMEYQVIISSLPTLFPLRKYRSPCKLSFRCILINKLIITVINTDAILDLYYVHKSIFHLIVMFRDSYRDK